MTHTHTFRSERGPILIALMTTNALVAINATLLAAAIPAVVADLGGLTLFPWLFSLYMLAQAASIPVYAKLADLYGRKPLILFLENDRRKPSYAGGSVELGGRARAIASWQAYTTSLSS